MEEGYSTLTSPFMNAIRTAHENATKEFDQFYHRVSKVMTPKRSQHQSNSNNIIHKATPRTTKRIQHKLNEQHSNNTSSLAPMTKWQSPTTARYQRNRDDHHYLKSPSSCRRRQNYPPPRPMTLTPNTTRTYSALDDRDYFDAGPSLDKQDDDKTDQRSNVYLRTPHRSNHTHSLSNTTSTVTTPSRIVYATPTRNTAVIDPNDSSTFSASTPSVILHDHLEEETRRLDQLQHDVFIVQQQSLALSRFSSSSPRCIQRMLPGSSDFSNKKTDSFLSPSSLQQQQQQQKRKRQQRGLLQRTKKYTQTASPGYQQLFTDSMTPRISQTSNPASLSSEPPPIFTTSTPLGSPSVAHQQLGKPQEHPLFTPPPQKLPTSTTNNTQPFDSPNVAYYSRRKLEQKSVTDLSNDILQTSLPTSNAIMNRINSKFRESSLQQHNNNMDITINSSTSNKEENRQQLSQTNSNMIEEEDMDRMAYVAEEQEDDEPLFQGHVKTLDQELGMAKDKFDTFQQRQQQQRIESKKFSLRPSGALPFLDDDDGTTLQNHGTIDGDQWTFAGQHYTLHEKQE